MVLASRSGCVYSLYFRVKGLIKFDTGWLKVDKVAVVGLFFLSPNACLSYHGVCLIILDTERKLTLLFQIKITGVIPRSRVQTLNQLLYTQWAWTGPGREV